MTAFLQDKEESFVNLLMDKSVKEAKGSRIVELTNESLNAVRVTTTENAELIREIAVYLEKQTSSVEEINQGMDQISSVIQSNSATAEQSAAAAQEMSAQAVAMNGIVEQFKLKQHGYDNIGALEVINFNNCTNRP